MFGLFLIVGFTIALGPLAARYGVDSRNLLADRRVTAGD